MASRETVLEQIRRLGDLRSGWDSYDAAPVSPRAMELAFRCAYEAERFFGGEYEPIVSPTPDGGVALIWRKPGREEVSAIFSPSSARYVVIGLDHQVAAQGSISDPTIFPREVLKPLFK